MPNVDLDDANPYDEDEPEKREAWEEGWRAFWAGKPPPSDDLLSVEDSRRMDAYLNGYAAAQTYEE